jgi:putative chitinase
MLDPAALARLYPKAPAAHRAALIDKEAALKAAGLFDPGHRLHIFLAQLGHESAGLTRTVESLYYTRPETLMAVWPRRFPSVVAALPYVRKSRALAEKVYGGRADLGNTQAGDGARFIGRGFLQITGRANYREMGERIGVDLEAEPELAARPDIAVRAACAYWTSRNLNAACDAGRFLQVTRKINGAAIGYADRVAWLQKAKACVAWPAGDALPLDLSSGPARRAASS